MGRSKKSLKSELKTLYVNLDILKERRAKHGINNAPIQLVNQIYDTEEAIAEIEAELEKFDRTQPQTNKPPQTIQPTDTTTQPWLWVVGVALVVMLCLGGLAVGILLPKFGDGTSVSGITSTATTFIPTRLPTSTATPTPTNTPRPPTSTPRPQTSTPIGSTKTRNADGMTMLYVPGGRFKMGSADSDTQADDDEKPQHNVTVKSFWIDKTEVTNAQYQLCVNAGTCKQSEYADDSTYNGDNQPVVGVDWNDSHAYCQWTGGRLPTEAEWEYAARGKDGLIYPWGNEFDGTKGNFGGNNDYANTAPVGSYLDGASWVGALDMSGNVWEWTQSTHKNYPYDANDGREDTKTTGVIKVLRGGSWSITLRDLRAANRDSYTGFSRYNGIGFRCVEVVP